MTPTRIVVRAFAKINLTLQVLGVRPDGYHELRTILQSVALHDTLRFRAAPGDLRIECDHPACPTDRTNLVWAAAEAVWRAGGRRGRPAAQSASTAAEKSPKTADLLPDMAACSAPSRRNARTIRLISG